MIDFLSKKIDEFTDELNHSLDDAVDTFYEKQKKAEMIARKQREVRENFNALSNTYSNVNENTYMNSTESEKVDNIPEIECKEATLNFWTVVFPGIFFAFFGAIGIGMPVALMIEQAESTGHVEATLILFTLIFGLVSIGAFIVMSRPIINRLILKMYGTEITGTVQGYYNDNLFINGKPAQIVRILVNSKEGPKCLLYQTHNTIKEFGVGEKVSILIYRDIALLNTDKQRLDNIW